MRRKGRNDPTHVGGTTYPSRDSERASRARLGIAAQLCFRGPALKKAE